MSHSFQIKCQIQGNDLGEIFLYLPNLLPEMIIGMDMLVKWNTILDFKNNNYQIVINIMHCNEPEICCSVGLRRLNETEEIMLFGFLKNYLVKFDTVQRVTNLIKDQIKLLDPNTK